MERVHVKKNHGLMVACVTSFYATRQSILGSNWSDFPTTLLMLDTTLCSLLLLFFFVFPGSWHFDICAARFFDELLQEHDGLPRVLAVDVPLLIQVTGGLCDDLVYF